MKTSVNINTKNFNQYNQYNILKNSNDHKNQIKLNLHKNLEKLNK